MVDGLPADIGIGVVLPMRSPSLATGLPVLPCTGIAPEVDDLKGECGVANVLGVIVALIFTAQS